MAHDDDAWVVACFIDPSIASGIGARFFDVVAAALARPKVRVGAARAMWLHTKRGGTLGAAKRAIIEAQLHGDDGDDSSDWAAFASQPRTRTARPWTVASTI